MAYIIKQQKRVVRDEFRNDFPQLCAPAPAPKPLDFSGIKNIEFPETPVKCVKEPEPPELPDYNALMCSALRVMRSRWDKWNMDHEIEYDYDYYDDGLYYDSTESEEESLSAEDPEEWSD